MTLIKSISGIRGTVGGTPNSNLTPIDIVEFTSAFATFLKSEHKSPSVAIGRDGRITGNSVKNLVIHTLVMSGVHVIDLDYSTTPTVEVAVTKFGATGGIIVTASHNPMNWNALKFLNEKGEFISAADGKTLLRFIDSKSYSFVDHEQQGKVRQVENAIEAHIDAILALESIEAELIRSKKFKVIVDPVNSTGSLAIPQLLNRLNCSCIMIHSEMSGRFERVAEPRPEHLHELCDMVKEHGADLGVALDPDVDRVAFVDENGRFIGEEYSLLLAADFILSKKKGDTVSNLSSTRALKDLTEDFGFKYWSSAVGEVNVVEKMKEKNAVIGGEGNGGIIYPELHYGRDALVGVAFVLNLMAERNAKLSSLRDSYSDYEIVKDKVDLNENTDVGRLLKQLEIEFSEENTNSIDGLKIDFDHGWVHIRKSNTENIIRIIAEARTVQEANELVSLIKNKVK